MSHEVRKTTRFLQRFGHKATHTHSATALMAATKDFFHLEASGGIILVLASALALVIANSPFFSTYHYLLTEMEFRIGFSDPGDFDFEIKKSLLLWINDGMMAIFFFLVGLEIKREFVEGQLSTRDRALLPAIAALGGMIVPALIYWFINRDSPETLAGWAIPAATDIAFALGVISLLGSRVPVSLKVLLTAIAIMDDLGAILIIAFFYAHGVDLTPLIYAGAATILLFILNKRHVSSTIPYILIGLVLWVAVLKSGVHATLAGVITALFIPMRHRDDVTYSPCKHLEHALHPWVAFGVLPIFGFANAGVPFAGMGLNSLIDPVTLGIIAGLILGKQLGIFSMLWLTIKSGLSPMPKNATWPQLYGISMLCGIGFTMSLFIGGLAFGDSLVMQAEVRLGVLVGSIISAILGYMLLKFARTEMRVEIGEQVKRKQKEAAALAEVKPGTPSE